MSIVMMVHIFMFAALKVEDKNVRPFLNNFVEIMENTAAGFMGTILLCIFGYYLLWSAHRGGVKFGLRFFFISFYPIVPRETFINAFFANCLITNIWMFALMQLCVQLFRNYLRGTDIAKIYMVQVQYIMGI